MTKRNVQTPKNPPKVRRSLGGQQEYNPNGLLQDVVDDYLIDLRAANYTPRTLWTAKQRLGWFTGWLKERGVAEIGEIRTAHIREWVGTLWDRGLADETVRTRVAALKAWFRWCVAERYMEDDPAANVRLPKVEQKAKPFVTPEQWKRLVDQAGLGDPFLASRRTAVLWVVAVTGMRLAELASLRDDSIDVETGFVRVMGKGRRERVAVLTPKALQAVRRYQRRRGPSKSGALWLTRTRTPMSYRAVRDDLEDVQQLAGVKLRDPVHIFRRTRAAQALREGLPREWVQAAMGWRTGAMLDRYAADMKREESEALRALKEIEPFP